MQHICICKKYIYTIYIYIYIYIYILIIIDKYILDLYIQSHGSFSATFVS